MQLKVKDSQRIIKKKDTEKGIEMTGLSDNIERFIIDLFEQEQEVNLQRNELAQIFNCAPSQINYVLTTRFSPEKGFVITSRRGGGGYVRIVRVKDDSLSLLRDLIVTYLDEPVNNNTARAIVERLLRAAIIDQRQARLILSAVSDRAICVKPPLRDVIRASVLKSMISGLMTD